VPTSWKPFSSTIPRTFAYDLNYDSTDDVLVVGTLGRGVWKLRRREPAFTLASHLHGYTPSDERLRDLIPITRDRTQRRLPPKTKKTNSRSRDDDGRQLFASPSRENHGLTSPTTRRNHRCSRRSRSCRASWPVT